MLCLREVLHPVLQQVEPVVKLHQAGEMAPQLLERKEMSCATATAEGNFPSEEGFQMSQMELSKKLAKLLPCCQGSLSILAKIPAQLSFLAFLSTNFCSLRNGFDSEQFTQF